MSIYGILKFDSQIKFVAPVFCDLISINRAILPGYEPSIIIVSVVYRTM